MGFNLTALAGRTAKVSVDFMGQTALITYNPMLLTTENMGPKTDSEEKFAQFFCELVTDWDVTMGNHKKVPITPEALSKIPMPFLREVYRTVVRNTIDLGEALSNSNGG